jgi:hypothetical protein
VNDQKTEDRESRLLRKGAKDRDCAGCFHSSTLLELSGKG